MILFYSVQTTYACVHYNMEQKNLYARMCTYIEAVIIDPYVLNDKNWLNELIIVIDCSDH